MGTTAFVAMLSEDKQDVIKRDIETVLLSIGEYNPKTVDNAMSGRLCDLEEYLDVNQYIK